MSISQDAILLRSYEPIIRFTKGEQFFPMDVTPYVRACSLWSQLPDQPPRLLVQEGKLTLEALANLDYDTPGLRYFLKFIEPLNVGEMAVSKFQGEEDAPFASGPGRLARVGYISRLVDAIYRLALLARGRVPGDTAAAAALSYRQVLAEHTHYRYFGRVVRQQGWIVLQYWYFYAFNNWRSRFSGANDHESDWEMVCIYLAEQPDLAHGAHSADGFRPEWVAYASHDYSGDDLRRRWDDPEIQKEGDHPLIFAGAGSHASYFSQGEYLTELTLPFTAPLLRASAAVQRFWGRVLRQYTGEESRHRFDQYASIFRIPFVDYARGDGLSIGPGQEHEWDEPVLLTPVPDWVSNYRGLWGLYTSDPFNGEDAPAGPMFNRDETVRRAWYDPVGWAGLDKVAPYVETLRQVRAEQDRLRLRQQELRTLIAEQTAALNGLGIRFEATRNQPHLVALHDELSKQISQQSTELNEVSAELSTNHGLLDALYRYEEALTAGDRGPLRAHISHAHIPAPPIERGSGRLAEFWAASSVGLMMVVMVLLAYFLPQYLGGGLVITIALFAFIEAGFRGRFTRLVTSVTISLTVVAALVLIGKFYWELIVLLVLIAGAYILVDNLREFFR